MKSNIMRALGALVSDTAHVSEMTQDPDGFLAKYGVTETSDKLLLYTCCRPLLGELFQRELADWHTLPPQDAVRWPGPDPEIRRFDPEQGTAGETVEIVIEGEAILETATARLVQQDVAAGVAPHVVELAVEKVWGTFRSTKLRCSADLSGAPAGSYAVQVINGDLDAVLQALEPPLVLECTSDECPGLPPLVAKTPFEVQAAG